MYYTGYSQATKIKLSPILPMNPFIYEEESSHFIIKIAACGYGSKKSIHETFTYPIVDGK
jgi:hypothetical protein